MTELLALVSVSDLAVVGVLFALFILAAAWWDTGILVLATVAMPVAGFVFLAFPYTNDVAHWLPESAEPYAPLGVFLFFWLAAMWVLRRNIGEGFGSKRPMQIGATAIALTVLLLLFSYHVVPFEGIYDFGPSFDAIFGSPVYFFWLTAFALLVLFVV